MSPVIYYLVAGAGVLLWMPILINFFRQWRARGNPVSLALAIAILLIMWWVVSGVWLITGAADTALVVYSSAGASILAALGAHYAFHRSKGNFPDQRKKGQHA